MDGILATAPLFIRTRRLTHHDEWRPPQRAISTRLELLAPDKRRPLRTQPPTRTAAGLHEVVPGAHAGFIQPSSRFASPPASSRQHFPPYSRPMPPAPGSIARRRSHAMRYIHLGSGLSEFTSCARHPPVLAPLSKCWPQFAASSPGGHPPASLSPVDLHGPARAPSRQSKRLSFGPPVVPAPNQPTPLARVLSFRACPLMLGRRGTAPQQNERTQIK